MKKLTTILLLFVFSFSISHGLVLDIHQEEHCSIESYLDEFSKPIKHQDTDKSDFCSSHYFFHISFIPPIIFSLNHLKPSVFLFSKEVSSHDFLHIKNNFRPPIFLYS